MRAFQLLEAVKKPAEESEKGLPVRWQPGGRRAKHQVAQAAGGVASQGGLGLGPSAQH